MFFFKLYLTSLTAISPKPYTNVFSSAPLNYVPSYVCIVSLAVNLCSGTNFSIRFYNSTILPLYKIYYILSIVFYVLLSLVYNSLYYYFNDSLFLVSSSISRSLLAIPSFNSFIISSTYFSLSSNYFFNLSDSIYIPFFSIF